jgi:CD109 antigen
MMGGLQGKTALTAYVAAALLQSGETIGAAKAVAYLESQISTISDAYAMALISYALELAQSPKAADAIQKLMGIAKENQNGFYWGEDIVPLPVPLPSKQGPVAGFAPGFMPPRPNRTVSIETTAYAVMALTLAKDNLDAGRAVKWLVSQRSAYGGYGSTQDTVVSLEALTKYATGPRAGVDLTVSVQSGSTVIKELKLNTANYDVLQIVELPIDKDIAVKVNGKGEAVGQLVTRYNLPEATPETAHDILKIDVGYDVTSVAVNDTLTVSATVSYNPPEPVEAGMVVVDISVPTGFAPVNESIDKAIAANKLFKRYDIAGRKVIFYIENLFPGDKVTFSFDAVALYPVKAKGVASTAYSYYKPEISAETLGQDVMVK